MLSPILTKRLLRIQQWTLLTNSWNCNGVSYGTYLCKHIQGCPRKQVLLNAPDGLTPIEWMRFVDDIFALWTHGIETLHKFLDYISIFHKHVNTRWLSLDQAVTQVLQQFPGLKSYFSPNDENKSRFRRLHALFEDPMTEVYLLFYQSSLQVFIQFSMFLQREDPIIPVAYEQTTSFLQKLASKFLTVAVKEANGDFSILDFKEPKFQHPDNLFIGFVTKIWLHKLIEEGETSPA